ncbi:4a-hydroxytetrahydrobiopterin dehydratase [bacterium]|nr:4a-hydroxytetrahydrobiopterin dehydratase [bacterium]
MKTIAEIFKGHGHFVEEDATEFHLKPFLNEALGLPKELPIESPRATWTQLEGPRRLYRKFELIDNSQVKFFLKSVLDYQEEIEHYGKLIIGFNEIEIEIYTHDLGEVTNLDIAYAKEVDMIFKDARSIGRSRYVR